MSKLKKTQLIARINSALDDIRPHLAVDGGNVEVVDVTEKMTVMIRWIGSCETCEMSARSTLAGVEQAVKSKVPEVSCVEAINGVGA